MNLEHELNRSWSLFQSGVPVYKDGGALSVDELAPAPLPGVAAEAPAVGAQTQLGDTATPDAPTTKGKTFNRAIDWENPVDAANYGSETITPSNVDARQGISYWINNTLQSVGVDKYLSRSIADRVMGTGDNMLGLVDIPVLPGAALEIDSAVRDIGHAIDGLDAGRDGAYEDLAWGVGRIALSLLGVGGATKAGVKVLGEIRDAAQQHADTLGKATAATAATAATLYPDDAEGAKLPAIKIGPATDAEKVLQIAPEYRVTVSGLPEPVGKQQFITNAINPKNYKSQSIRLDDIAKEFPDPLSDARAWTAMSAKVYNSLEVPLPPTWLIEHANDMPKWSEWFNKLTPQQIDGAAAGFSVADNFKKLYREGAGAEVTGQLMLWSMMSRMLSAFPHESGYIDIASKANPFIAKAVRGEWSAADTAAWKQMVSETIPLDSPGRSATSNANDFGAVFLRKMSEMTPEGMSKLEALHMMVADPNMTGPQVRRAFYGLAEDVGIKNKVLSFALLVSGRDDVIVLDRIQINQMFGGGAKIYDNIQHLFDNGPGLATYEALERSLGSRVKELYAAAGRPQDASLGRYHWETWVLSSGQIVEHPTLKSIVAAGNSANAPYANVPVAEGRFHRSQFGATYERTEDGGTKWVYRTSEGEPYQFQKSELDAMFKEALKPKNGVVPKDFPGVSKFEGGDIPWYDYPGVDRGKLDSFIKQFGRPARP